MISPVPPDEGKPVGQREASRSGELLHNGERADAWRAEPAARGGGGGQEQNQPGVLTAGGAGEAEEGAECHTAREEDHRGLGTNLQRRNGESKTGSTSISVHVPVVVLVLHHPVHRVHTVVLHVPPSVSCTTGYVFFSPSLLLVVDRRYFLRCWLHI